MAKIKFKSLLATTALPLFMAVSPPSHAFFGGFGGPLPVIDGTNLVENILTAIQTAEQIMLQTALATQNFNHAEVFLQTEEKDALMQFIRTGKDLHGSLRKTQDVFDDLQRAFAVSPFENFEDFLANFEERKEHGDSLAKGLYDSAVVAEDELQKAHDQYSRIVAHMPNINGVADAAKTTAQSVGVLIQQTQGMLQLMAKQARTDGQELQRQYNERAQLEKTMKESLESQNKTFDSDLEMLNRILEK